MIKISETKLKAALRTGFIDEIQSMEKTAAGTLTLGAKAIRSLLGVTRKFLVGAGHTGGQVETVFGKAIKAFDARGGRAMLDELAKHQNPLYYLGKGKIPRFDPSHHAPAGMLKDMPQGLIRSVGTTAAKIQDLTAGMTGSGQSLLKKTTLFAKNLPNMVAKDIRGNFKYKQVFGIEDKLKSGRVFMKQKGKILDANKALKLYQKNPEKYVKNLNIRFGGAKKMNWKSRSFEGLTGTGGAAVRKRLPMGVLAAA